MKKNIYKLFSHFCLRNISEEFDTNESKEVPFKGNVYDFLVDFKIIDKSNILNTRV